jgi:hypothetical protein
LHGSRDCVERKHRANIDCEENRRRPGRYLLKCTIACFGDDFDALRLPGCNAYGQHRARVFMLDGSSKTSMHATPLLSSRPPPTSGVQATFLQRTAASPQGLGGFAAVRPNCGKQKKLSDVYDMRHNFASRCLFILHDLIAENAKTIALARAKVAGCRATSGNSTA